MNGGRHEHNYSTLHFGALSGNAEVCQLLLQYGCRSDRVNSVGRTPAQMAAFVGALPLASPGSGSGSGSESGSGSDGERLLDRI